MSGVSAVVTLRPDGTQPRWLGALGHVTGLTYSYVNPGGCDQLSCLLQLPPEQRTDAMNPGRIVQVWRGGACVWDGKLAEPVPGDAGWQVTADGAGHQGADFVAYYTSAWGTVTQANQVLDNAISRGLRWTRAASVPAGVWFGQPADPASMDVGAFLSLLCTKGGYTWYVTTGPMGNAPAATSYYGMNYLSVYALPATTLANVTRILVSATPVSRTLGGDYNSLWLRYQNNNSAASVTYATANVTTAASITAHQPLEAFDDLSSAGFQSAGTVQAAGNSVLARYQRASFGGPFTVRHGQLLNPGGAPCDLGTDHCGQVCRMILADAGAGGEIVPGPVIFMIGSYAWNEDAQTAAVAPFQSVRESFSGLLGVLNLTIKHGPPPPRPRKPYHPYHNVRPVPRLRHPAPPPRHW